VAFVHYDTLTADELIRPLVDRTFAANDGTRSVGERHVPLPVVLVGSVLVTGSTVSRFSRRTDVNVIGIAHLTVHKESKKDLAQAIEVAALEWLPPGGTPRPATRLYERIPGTSHIIRGGDLAITLPRFSAPTQGAKIMRSSLYGDDPNTAYGFW
jgi:hypothetical protein